MSFSLDVHVERRRIKNREPVTIELSFPPSNPERFADWEGRAGWKIVANRPPRVPGPVKITMQFEDRPGSRELGSVSSPVVALLAKFGVIDGVCHEVVREVDASWSLAVARGVRVTIQQATP